MEGRLVKALFKSALVASVVFAAAWFRTPPTNIIPNLILYSILVSDQGIA